MSTPAFIGVKNADEDAARGYREEVRTVAEFRAARLCGRCRMAHAGRCTARYDWTVSHRGTLAERYGIWSAGSGFDSSDGGKSWV